MRALRVAVHVFPLLRAHHPRRPVLAEPGGPDLDHNGLSARVAAARPLQDRQEAPSRQIPPLRQRQPQVIQQGRHEVAGAV